MTTNQHLDENLNKKNNESIKTEFKYIYFEKIDFKGKTEKYRVMNKKHKYPLGIIKWDTWWRQYCFFTEEEELILSVECMTNITQFINELEQKRKKKR